MLDLVISPGCWLKAPEIKHFFEGTGDGEDKRCGRNHGPRLASKKSGVEEFLLRLWGAADNRLSSKPEVKEGSMTFFDGNGKPLQYLHLSKPVQ